METVVVGEVLRVSGYVGLVGVSVVGVSVVEIAIEVKVVCKP